MRIHSVSVPEADDHEIVESRIRAAFDEKHFYKLANGQFFVAANITTKEVYFSIVGKTGEDDIPEIMATVVVATVGTYWGFAAGDFWEWMDLRRGEEDE